jgi:ornithine--oxo-acid transaminase
MDIRKLVAGRISETYDLHRRFVNPQLVRVLEVIGFNRNYCSAQGAYLTDEKGQDVLDFLAGFGVFNIGRNHPEVIDVLHQMLDAGCANLIQMDLGCISGLLAEALCNIAPGSMDAVFFTNSGAESVEGALKFARQAQRKPGVVYCEHAFHGLTLGALSVNGAPEFRKRNEPLLPHCEQVPFGDLEALEASLAKGDKAAFIFEPIQGKGVFPAPEGYLQGARELCDKHEALLIADEVQTGLGRTGRMFAVEHWDAEPDIITISKALSGGFIPVGAVITKRSIHAKVFDSMDRCFAHSNTFGQNDLAMAAGLATLDVIQSQHLAENARTVGDYIRKGLEELRDRYEMLTEIRGRGLMIGLQFGRPKAIGLKTGWKLLHSMNENLFCQMITIPLLEKHNILTQVAGHGLDTVKILPPLIIGQAEADRFLTAMEDVLKQAHRFPGSAWTTVKNLGLRTARTSA